MTNDETGRYYKHLIALTAEMKPLVTAVVHPVDVLSICGALEAAAQQLIIPVLVGPEAKIRQAAKEAGLSLADCELVDTKHSHAAAERAVELVREGRVEAIMKGKIHTRELLLPVMSRTSGLRTERRMSHVFALDPPQYHKPLFLTDAVVNIAPNLAQKKDIVQNAIDCFRLLTGKPPKVAILSATEDVDEKIQSTLDAAALCKMADRGQITGGILDGPLGMDNAISVAAAQAKGIHSEVAGDADILVMPDIEAGNILYKQMRYLSGIDGAGIVLGARVPVILASRASEVHTRKASAALALIVCRRGAQFADFANP
ncbi:phosphate acetyltransferase [Kineobactrum sediminis]|uniref:Phosphate acetyltransferase n=1 Tax=Kineobactrum sediminis TaxID=1905677 RepID=A0A2N5Y1J3_9GAMM|nr:bifunctional enoyl-CoA hydratase/phosphate acetyltransferase [Kineobactrum sediminis]PLW82258.1 phosphate acetyltransferase [Kineobactrum sediminis]